MKKKIFINKIILILFVISSCSLNLNTSEFNKQSSNYKICLNDANSNIEKKVNINQDRNDMLQTDDALIDLYNIENEIDKTKLSNVRTEMIDDCMKSR